MAVPTPEDNAALAHLEHMSRIWSEDAEEARESIDRAKQLNETDDFVEALTGSMNYSLGMAEQFRRMRDELIGREQSHEVP